MSHTPSTNEDSTCSATLWDAQDLARFLKVSRSWVYHRAEAGELPCLRVGGLLSFDPEAIQAFARGAPTRGARVVPFARRKG
jgi:hypothetical protein